MFMNHDKTINFNYLLFLGFLTHTCKIGSVISHKLWTHKEKQYSLEHNHDDVPPKTTRINVTQTHRPRTMRVKIRGDKMVVILKANI